jgi:hypothetical protein
MVSHLDPETSTTKVERLRSAIDLLVRRSDEQGNSRTSRSTFDCHDLLKELYSALFQVLLYMISTDGHWSLSKETSHIYRRE